jgi:glycosyltransferase involved in cell wall biosynthesis
MGHKVAMDARIPEWVVDGGCDVVVAQRTCEPGPSGIWQRTARAGHSKLVFEIDDDLWNVDPSNRASYGFYDADRRRRLVENITVADLVTVTTEPLADLVSQWNPNVVILPNMVPAWMLTHDRPRNASRVTIGWGGGPSHSRDFGEVARPLKRILQRFGDAVEFHNIGEDYSARVASNRGRTRFSPWCDSVGDYLRTVDYDIAATPLRPSVFNDSKSDLKLLEASALGIPSIVSDTGPYERAVLGGAPALTATTHREWEERLVELIQSPTDREQLGKEAREWASKRTVEGNAHLWADAYSTL